MQISDQERPEQDAVQALEALRALGSAVLYCQADVSDKAMRTAMLAAIRECYGRLHVLVNNAGTRRSAIFHRSGDRRGRRDACGTIVSGGLKSGFVLVALFPGRWRMSIGPKHGITEKSVVTVFDKEQ